MPKQVTLTVTQLAKTSTTDRVISAIHDLATDEHTLSAQTHLNLPRTEYRYYTENAEPTQEFRNHFITDCDTRDKLARELHPCDSVGMHCVATTLVSMATDLCIATVTVMTTPDTGSELIGAVVDVASPDYEMSVTAGAMAGLGSMIAECLYTPPGGAVTLESGIISAATHIKEFTDAAILSGIDNEATRVAVRSQLAAQLIDPSDTRRADNAAAAVMDNLNDRRGVLDDVDTDIQQEIQVDLADIIYRHYSDYLQPKE